MDQISPANDRPKLTRAEAARRNGALSRGPRTPEGKRRSSMNALKHGLTAATFTLVPGEDGAAFDELEARLAARYRPRDELSAHLVQRLASVMWRQYRADRLEAEVLAEPGHAGASPYAPLGWDAARFAAVQRHQARLDRTLFRLLDALERCQPAPEEEEEEPEPGEPEERQNEPEQPASEVLEPIGTEDARNEPGAASAEPDRVGCESNARPGTDALLVEGTKAVHARSAADRRVARTDADRRSVGDGEAVDVTPPSRGGPDRLSTERPSPGPCGAPPSMQRRCPS